MIFRFRARMSLAARRPMRASTCKHQAYDEKYGGEHSAKNRIEGQQAAVTLGQGLDWAVLAPCDMLAALMDNHGRHAGAHIASLSDCECISLGTCGADIGEAMLLLLLIGQCLRPRGLVSLSAYLAHGGLRRP